MQENPPKIVPKESIATEPQYAAEFKGIIGHLQTALAVESGDEVMLASNRVLLEDSIKEFIQDHSHRFDKSAKTVVSKSGLKLLYSFEPNLDSEQISDKLNEAAAKLILAITELEDIAINNNIIETAIFYIHEPTENEDNGNKTDPANSHEYLRLLQLYHQLLSLYIPTKDTEL